MPASVHSSTELAVSNEYSSSPKRSSFRHTKLPGIINSRLPPSPVDSHGDISGDIFEEASATALEQRRLTREITRGTPGDPRLSFQLQSHYQKDVARKRSQYYEKVFAVNPKSPNFSPRDRILRESFIMADIKTNVVIPDEYAFMTDLSYALSTRYQRPENSILVTVAHSCCQLFGGSFDPSYIMTITALPSQVLPITNRRNSVLIGKLMEDTLGVPPNRGIIKFTAIAEENLANDGRTVALEIEELEKVQKEDRSTPRSLSSHGTYSTRRKPSLKALRIYKVNQLPTHDEAITSSPILPTKSNNEYPVIPEVSAGAITRDRQNDRVQKMGRRRSFISSIFGRAG